MCSSDLFPSHDMVYTVDVEQGTKIEVAKKSGIDIFVDDRYDNFIFLFAQELPKLKVLYTV